MGSFREVGIAMSPNEVDEAPGVTIRRTIGSEKLVLLDPFLLVDHVSAPGSSAGQSVGFQRHPHRGIETLTYVVNGQMNHQDSLGNDDSIGAQESQWMTAAGGIFHSEMLGIGEAGHESIQIWVNMPAARKTGPAEYRAGRASAIPAVEEAGSVVRVVAGSYGEAQGPFQGFATGRMTYLAVEAAPNATLTLPAPAGETAFAYLFAGSAAFDAKQTLVEAPQLFAFCDGEGVQVTAGEGGARFVLASAPPLKEPVIQYRSLVMSSVEEMKKALDDLAAGTFA